MTRMTELPGPQKKALDLVKEVAAEKDCRPFLVGGPVRDLLLGRSAIDVDLTIEEDSSTLARALAKKMNGRVRSFPQFLTYKVTADGLPDIDIATARKEKYRKPGALPAVTPGRLKDDLMRRDFSINAIAIDLLDGTMHDPADGERDLGERLVRVLHPQSFGDDPTRIFRAIRLAQRLDFAIEPGTLAWMRAAIAAGALQTISKERIWRELFFAMDEAAAPAILETLHREKALSPLFGTDSNHEPGQSLSRIGERVADDEEADRYVLFTGALLRGSGATPAQLEGSGFSQKRAKAVLQIANDFVRIEQAIEDANSDRQRFRLFKRVGPEVLNAFAAEHPADLPLVRRYQEFRHFTIPVRGNDLEVPSGPHVAKALERTREAVFTGEITANDARTFARELALKYLSQNQPDEALH